MRSPQGATMAAVPTSPDVVKLYAVIGERMAKARDRKGMSQEDLAAQVGLSRASITQAEGGQQKLPLQSLYLIAGVLGAAIADLLPTVDELTSTGGGSLCRSRRRCFLTTSPARCTGVPSTQ